MVLSIVKYIFLGILSKTLGDSRLDVYDLAGSNFSLKKDNLYLSTIRLSSSSL